MTTSEELLDLCRRHIDPHAQPIAQHAGHDQTSTLRATTSDGDVIVKIHRSRERHERELHAYHQWAPALSERVPRLLADIDDPPAIIVTAAAGTLLAELDLPPDIEHDVFGQAGTLLAAWHNAEPARDSPNMTAWLAHRGEQWLKLAEQVLTARERADTRAHLRDLAALGPLPTVPCHLDFTPRNLVLDPLGALRVIDFEHARYDLAARDLVRLADRIWRHRPDLEDAFLSRYGSLSDLDRQVIKHCTHLDAVTAAVRATGRTLPTETPT